MREQPPTAPNVLDVRGGAKIRQIRAMAGRAMLDGPHEYQVAQLEGPLLDLAVSKAEGLKAVIHKVDNAISPFFECCVLNECGRLQYQYIPSRLWTQGGPIIDRERPHAIESCNGGSGWYVRGRHLPCDGDQFYGETLLIAAMRCFVHSKLGATVRM